MSKVKNRSCSSSPSELEREFSRVPISQQKINFNNEPREIVILVNNFISEFGDVRTTKWLDLLWNSSVNTRLKLSHVYKIIDKNISKSSKITKKRWVAVKNSNQHEYKFWEKLTEIANLKHKLLYPNYKYIPIRNKNKKCRSNNTYKQYPSLVVNDIIKTTEIESNKKIDSLQIQETNNTQALSVNNNSTTPIRSCSDSYLIHSFLPYYLFHEYRPNFTASSIMLVHNPYFNYLQCYQPQGYFIFNDLIDTVLINKNSTVDSNFSSWQAGEQSGELVKTIVTRVLSLFDEQKKAHLASLPTI
ncbi:15883_t:CDS:2 [Racocetra persica]|uniref:15883_t:CDS:1 n=1 Tax=Racocetra persica TaxID=160502 RepID=A0ACA9KUJ7_9GLOM|nr:15883_t:CDS:2 [Racocetra persica]